MRGLARTQLPSTFCTFFLKRLRSSQEKIKQYTEVGVDQFLLAFQDPLDTKALELFIDAVGR